MESNNDKEKVLVDLCRKELEDKLGWGNPQQWYGQEFERLSDQIFDATSIKLSETTLKRFLGRVKYNNAPSLTTLDALSAFLGYPNWRTFVTKHSNGKAEPPAVAIKHLNSNKGLKRFFSKATIIISLVIVGLVFAGWYFSGMNLKEDAYYSRITFSSNPVSRGLPNTIVFNVDGHGLNTAGMFVQQSWDTRLRTEIKPGQNQIATTYYYPGYFRAKLVKNDEVLKEHDVFILTEGWLMTVSTDPVPIYINNDELGGKLSVPEKYSQQIAGVNLEKPVRMGFHYYKDFDNIKGDNFSFAVNLKNTSEGGNLVCKKTQVLVHCTEGIISFPLSIAGCSGEMNVMVLDNFMSGKENDFSDFGVDFNEPVKFSVTSSEGNIKAFINDELIKEVSLHRDPGKVVGVRIEFHGTGEVYKLSLKNGDGTEVLSYPGN